MRVNHNETLIKSRDLSLVVLSPVHRSPIFSTTPRAEADFRTFPLPAGLRSSSHLEKSQRHLQSVAASTSNMSMFSTGILVLTSPLHTLPLRIAPVLSSAAQHINRTLYVHLHPGLNLGGGAQPRPVFIPPAVDLSSFISRLYSNAADVCGHLDVRVLLSNVCAHTPGGSGGSLSAANCPFPSPQLLSHCPEVVLTDFPLQDPGQSHQVTQCLQRYTGHCYACSPTLPSVLLHPQLVKVKEEELEEAQEESVDQMETYNDVVVGGTFDRLHGAHKTLLNFSCLLANRRFLIGVCDKAMLKSKWLGGVLVSANRCICVLIVLVALVQGRC